MTEQKMNMYEVSVNLITNEKLYGGDWESDHYNEWSDEYKILVASTSIEEALEIAKAKATKAGDKWRTVSHLEQIATKGFRDHIVYNNEYTDKLHKLYG